jgi:hypothetical protein
VTVTKYCCLLFVVTHAPVVAALSFIAVAVVLALLCKLRPRRSTLEMEICMNFRGRANSPQARSKSASKRHRTGSTATAFVRYSLTCQYRSNDVQFKGSIHHRTNCGGCFHWLSHWFRNGLMHWQLLSRQASSGTAAPAPISAIVARGNRFASQSLLLEHVGRIDHGDG